MGMNDFHLLTKKIQMRNQVIRPSAMPHMMGICMLFAHVKTPHEKFKLAFLYTKNHTQKCSKAADVTNKNILLASAFDFYLFKF